MIQTKISWLFRKTKQEYSCYDNDLNEIEFKKYSRIHGLVMLFYHLPVPDKRIDHNRKPIYPLLNQQYIWTNRRRGRQPPKRESNDILSTFLFLQISLPLLLIPLRIRFGLRPFFIGHESSNIIESRCIHTQHVCDYLTNPFSASEWHSRGLNESMPHLCSKGYVVILCFPVIYFWDGDGFPDRPF